MKTVIIHKTKSTPEVTINYFGETFTIDGVSEPDDPLDFYEHVVEEFKKYKKLKSGVVFVIKLQSMNSGSIKGLLNLFKEASSFDYTFKKAEVEWMFPKNDKLLKESGQVFEHISRLKFNYREI